MLQRLEMIALPKFPLVEPGDNVVEQIIQSLRESGLKLQHGDLLVIAQKVISKAENRYVYLNEVTVSEHALELARQVDKDPRLVQLILDESEEVIRHRPGVIIVEHKLGYVHANAGIDKSNIISDTKNPRVLLLPKNPDASAVGLRAGLEAKTGIKIPIIINDSAGRAWRNGVLGFAIGSAGFQPVMNLVGQKDLFACPLEVTCVAVADELAAAASFMMGQAAEAVPVVLVRGAKFPVVEVGSSDLIRPRSEDLFR
ncbi:MAG: coenzyme F420-0:L-glutamate ligase [Porticoccaceae bacterium]|jgi:coenzyme F420-0:L-glutamate ligase/coenzyme F420-1:gamma-L-glutamate ligase